MLLSENQLKFFVSKMKLKKSELDSICIKIKLENKSTQKEFLLSLEHTLNSIFDEMEFIDGMLDYGNARTYQYYSECFEELKKKYLAGKSIIEEFIGSNTNHENNQDLLQKPKLLRFDYITLSSEPSSLEKAYSRSQQQNLLLQRFIHKASIYIKVIKEFDYDTIENVNDNIRILNSEYNNLCTEANALVNTLDESNFRIYLSSGYSLDNLRVETSISEWKLKKIENSYVSKSPSVLDENEDLITNSFLVQPIHIDNPMKWRAFKQEFEEKIGNSLELKEESKLRYLVQSLKLHPKHTERYNNLPENLYFIELWNYIIMCHEENVRRIIKSADQLFKLPLSTFNNTKRISNFILELKKNIKYLNKKGTKLGSFEIVVLKMLIAKFEYDYMKTIELKSCKSLNDLLNFLEKRRMYLSKPQCISM